MSMRRIAGSDEKDFPPPEPALQSHNATSSEHTEKEAESCHESSLRGRRGRSSEEEEAEECKLHDEVVQRIIAMIPFPQLFKVRVLTKTWYSRFPRSGFQDPVHTEAAGAVTSASARGRAHHKLNKLPAEKSHSQSSSSFQDLVTSQSHKWPGYCPVILGNEGLLGYDSMQKKWKGVFSDLQQLLGSSTEPWLISSCGPLICGVSQSPNSHYDVFITNVITRQWKTLPSRPNAKVPSVLSLFFDETSGYKVFLLTEDPYDGPYDEGRAYHNYRIAVNTRQRSVCSQVFDSLKGTWTVSQALLPFSTSFAWRSCGVHLAGSMYCLAGDDRNPIDLPLQFWSYSLRDSTWTEIRHPFARLFNGFSGRSVIFDLTRFKIFACGSRLVVALVLDPQTQTKPQEHKHQHQHQHRHRHRHQHPQQFEEDHDGEVPRDTLFIYELDPETQNMVEKSKGPPVTVLANSEHIVSDGVTIYFSTLDLHVCHHYPVVAYDVARRDWSYLEPVDFQTLQLLTNKRWADFAFQPGLKPFVTP